MGRSQRIALIICSQPRMTKHKAVLLAGQKCTNPRCCIAKNELSSRRGAVADSQPNHFGRTAQQRTPLRKVRVLRKDRKSVFLRVLPNLYVGGAAKTAIPQVERLGIDVGESSHQSRRKILVEEKLHNVTISNLRSPSAAKAKHARISFSVRSGKSARISA